MTKTKLIALIGLIGLMGPMSPISQAQNTDRGFEIAKNLEIFSSIYKSLNQNYVDDVDPGKTIKVAIDAMLGSLDPYTNYFPESDIEDVGHVPAAAWRHHHDFRTLPGTPRR